MKVSKFGGTSLANANQIRKALAIVRADPERQCIVVSAPGKRSPQDQKITDFLFEWHHLHELKLSPDEIRRIVSDRYAEIVRDLGINFDLASELTEINRRINRGASADYAASRGEYLIGKIVAKALGYEFIDPAACICFDKHGRYHQADDWLRTFLLGRRTVIPGFYGSLPNRSIKTFSRGGSDITGAIVARAVGASLYENWTDVSGLLTADPRVVESPRQIQIVTYRELRELAYMGANVFHEEAMFPVKEAGIATVILNTNEPNNPGTLIVGEIKEEAVASGFIGVAGHKNFTVITLEKAMMNRQIGFARRILTVLEENGISFEHLPGGIDALSLIIDDRQLNDKLGKIVREIKQVCSPDTIEVLSNLALIAVVGRAMVKNPETAAKIFAALAEKGINLRMINQGSSQISIIIGVENADYENAVRAIYTAFVK